MKSVIVDHQENVNLTFITDIHLADRAPGRRRDNYRQAILDKLDYASKLTNHVKGACICGGDYFHIKNPRSNSHGLVADAITNCRSFPGERIYGIVGNHDIMEDNISTLDSQPLGVLIDAGVYESISEPTIFLSGNGKTEVMVVGFDYKNTEDTLEAIKAFSEKYMKDEIREGMDVVAVIHQVGRPGEDGDFFGEKTLGYNTISKFGFNVVLWGHDHSRVEPMKIGMTHHLHFGSLSRASLSQDETDRPVVVPVISFSPKGIKIIEKEVPVTPLEATFLMADRGVKGVGKSDEMKMFLDEMEEQVSEVETDDPVEILEQICQEKDIVDLVKDFCEL